ncbi:MAG: ArnT family glycosyltransferase [Ktedonobacteraceae bacterium]
MLSLLHSKRFSISPYGLCICALIAAATLARFILIYFNWPVTNSDEGNMGLIALHIAYQGDHPTFFYGLPYMGPLEGYIAAPLFLLFGPSLFALRLGLLPLFTLFLICMYYLTRLLYSKGLALFIVVLFSLGSADVIIRQLKAVGEYPEIELFAALISLLAAWLALSHPSSDTHPATWLKWRRILVYSLLGLIVGLALWVDFLILPFVVTAGLLLFLFCRRELFSWSGLSLLLGTIIGAFPLIYYNLTAPPGENSLNTLLLIHQADAAGGLTQHVSLLKQIFSTIMIGLPLTTGANPRCSGATLASFGSPTSSMLPCEIFHGGWSMGFLVLWTGATFLATAFIWQRHHQGSACNWSFEQRQDVVRQCCRLMLLISAGLTIVLYAASPLAALYPFTAFRYLTCVLIAAPAVLWPLWMGIRKLEIAPTMRAKAAFILKGSILLFIGVTFLLGTVRTFQEIPAAQAAYASEDTLVRDLLHNGATYIYSDYWTCNRLIFHSHEQIICSVLTEELKPGFNRYTPYVPVVKAAPHPAYVFALGSPFATAFEQRILSQHHYQRHTSKGYVIYQEDSS